MSTRHNLDPYSRNRQSKLALALYALSWVGIAYLGSEANAYIAHRPPEIHSIAQSDTNTVVATEKLEATSDHELPSREQAIRIGETLLVIVGARKAADVCSEGFDIEHQVPQV